MIISYIILIFIGTTTILMEFSGTQTGLILLHNLESLDLIKEFKNLTTKEIK